MEVPTGFLFVTLLLSSFVATSHGVLFSTLKRTLTVAASPTAGQVLKAGEDKITITWGYNNSFPAGTDSDYKTIKVKLCYAPISQKDRKWRKTVDLLKKDKTCLHKIVNRPYAASNNTFTWTVERDVPSAIYFVRAYAFDAQDVQVAYGQTTDAHKATNLFEVQAITGRHVSLDIASICFSAFSVVSLAFFFYLALLSSIYSSNSNSIPYPFHHLASMGSINSCSNAINISSSSMEIYSGFLVVSLLLSCFVATTHGVYFSSLKETLTVTASPTKGQVLKAGEDKITITWGFNNSFPAGTDSDYKTIKVKLCYAPISQKDRKWRKTVDLLKKDKTCLQKIVSQPYAASNNSFTWTVERDVPSAIYFVRAYAFDAQDVQVAYGQTTDAHKTTNLFEVQAITGRHVSLDIASICFSAFSVVSLAFFFYLEKRNAKASK